MSDPFDITPCRVEQKNAIFFSEVFNNIRDCWLVGGRGVHLPYSISTKGALRIPMIYDNHPSHPIRPTYSSEWTKQIWVNLRWPEMTERQEDKSFWLHSDYFWLFLTISEFFGGDFVMYFWSVAWDDHWSKKIIYLRLLLLFCVIFISDDLV